MLGNSFGTLLSMSGQKFIIERNEEFIQEVDGLANWEQSTNRKYIGFIPNTDVKAGDWLKIASSASVVARGIWNKMGWLWAIIVAISSIINIIRPHFTYDKQIIAINYILPELKELLTDIEHYYNSIADHNDSEIADKIQAFRQRYIKLENKFI